MKEKLLILLPYFICFILPLTCYFFTISDSLGFIDSAEFALVTFLGSVAHPPGTPSYVLLGWLWTKIVSFFTDNHILNITLFSVFCSALFSTVNYSTSSTLLQLISNKKLSNLKVTIAAITCSLSLSFGLTFWNWANTVEVYSLQILCGSIMINGLVKYQINKTYKNLTIACVGYAIGLANHHLYMILFTPLMLFFFTDNLFIKTQKSNSKIKKNKTNLIEFLTNIFKSRHFLYMVVLTTVITAIFYLFMMIRAKNDFPFEFGNPDTIARLWEHITGKVYTQMLLADEKSPGFLFIKLPYFTKMLFNQYLFFLPFLLLGIYYLIHLRLFRLLFLTTSYYIFNLWMHLQASTASGDEEGHMVIPLLVLGILIIYGACWFMIKFKLYWVLIALILCQIGYNYAEADKKDYNVSESLMDDLDKSSPENSIIIISDWTQVIQYYYYRISKNFRPDLVVLNYDMKFTNYKILPTLYPEFYKLIEKEYMNFVNELAKEHPEQIYNTGCSLSTQKLINAEFQLIKKLESLAASRNAPLLLDPKAYYSFMNLINYKPQKIYPSGCFVSNLLTNQNTAFLDLNQKWLNSELLLTDAKADNKLVDIEAMLDIYKDYYLIINDIDNNKKANIAKDKIKSIQKKMQENMPQVYHKKFQLNLPIQKNKF